MDGWEVDRVERNARLAALREVREMVADRVEAWNKQDSKLAFDRGTEAGLIRTVIDTMIAKEEGR